MSVRVTVDHPASSFLISGDDILLERKRRLRTFFSREGVKVVDNKVLIHFGGARGVIKTFQEIERACARSGVEIKTDSETDTLTQTYQRELESFNLFSESARKIRNNELEGNLEVEFQKFAAVIRNRFKRTLYDMQLLSAFHLAFSQNACNFAVPGAGKTSIVLGAFAYLNSLDINDPKYVENLLIVGPLSSFAPWEMEYKECFGEWSKSVRVSGGDVAGESSDSIKSPLSTTFTNKADKVRYFYSNNLARITLMSHSAIAGLQQEVEHFMSKKRTLLVIDEAHRIKNPDGLWGNAAVEISEHAAGRAVLTGTPLPQGYQDIYNLIRFLYPYKFEDILRNYSHQDLTDLTLYPDEEEVEKIVNTISPFFIRIKKSDMELTPATEQPLIKVAMDDDQRAIYDFIEKDYMSSYDSLARQGLTKAKLIRLRQAAINPALLMAPISDLDRKNLESPERLPSGDPHDKEYAGISDRALIDMINEYQDKNVPPKFLKAKEVIDKICSDSNEKVIIWTIFIANAKSLQSYLLSEGIDSRLLIGEVDTSTREDVINRFNNPENEDFRVVIANPFSVAESISLHKGCHNALYIERDYNCANFAQSKDRIHRFGLPEGQKTNYYYLLSEDSVDEHIHQRLLDKMELMEKAIDQEIPLFNNVGDRDDANSFVTEALRRYKSTH